MTYIIGDKTLLTLKNKSGLYIYLFILHTPKTHSLCIKSRILKNPTMMRFEQTWVLSVQQSTLTTSFGFDEYVTPQ